MTADDLKTVAAIVGASVGVLGFLYGFWKDRRLRQIEQRAKSPHFVFSNIQIDVTSWSISRDNSQDNSHYSYGEQARKLTDNLPTIDNIQEAPKDYPDGRIFGIVLKNEGAVLRSFKVKCREEHVFQASESYCNYYKFRYKFDRATLGQPILFTIIFETEAGYRGKQIWQLQKGTSSLERIKPKPV
jgi:hypothetical protein